MIGFKNTHMEASLHGFKQRGAGEGGTARPICKPKARIKSLWVSNKTHMIEASLHGSNRGGWGAAPPPPFANTMLA